MAKAPIIPQRHHGRKASKSSEGKNETETHKILGQ